MKNYYEILEVNQNASREVIDKAYKVLVKKYHPDQYDGEKRKIGEKKMKEINEAYHVLSDEFLREQYDSELKKEIENFYSQKYRNREQQNEERRQRGQTINNQQEANSHRENNYNGKNETETAGGKKEYKRKVGTFSGLVELTKELYSNRPKREEFKEMTKKDILAVILTIIVVIIIGIILWFIPFTNGWMRELLFENPIFNWIGKIFTK